MVGLGVIGVPGFRTKGGGGFPCNCNDDGMKE